MQQVEEREQKRAGRGKEIWSWIWVFLWALILALFINNVLIVNAEVVSGSMETTIMTGERVMGNRMAYWFSEPERYDIVMFINPDNKEEDEIYVKRIIGLPGETVEIIGGKVYINDELAPLPDYFTPEAPVGNYGPYLVPRNHYFMMGDNRNNSSDSKSWENHYVYKRAIKGKVMFVYYPKPRFVEKIEALEDGA